jgi:hypothetical protein
MAGSKDGIGVVGGWGKRVLTSYCELRASVRLSSCARGTTRCCDRDPSDRSARGRTFRKSAQRTRHRRNKKRDTRYRRDAPCAHAKKRKPSAEFVHDIALRPCDGSCADGNEIIRHVAEDLEDHRVVEFAEVGTATPRESNRARIRLIARHCGSAADRRRLVRTFDGLSGHQPAFRSAERQRDVNRSPSPASKNWMPRCLHLREQLQNTLGMKVK